MLLKFPSGKTESVTLTENDKGAWSAVLDSEELGIHTVEGAQHRALAHMGPVNPREYTDVRSTTETLSSLAEEANGSVRRIADVNGSGVRVVPMRSARSYAGGNWIGLKTTDAYILRGVDRISLLAGFLGLAILLGLLSATWYREGR